MSKVVWKQELFKKGSAVDTVKLPSDAKILFCGMQRDTICIWYQTDQVVDRADRTFHLFGTGHEGIPHDAMYVGTVMTNPDQAFVFHVYEKGRLAMHG